MAGVRRHMLALWFGYQVASVMDLLGDRQESNRQSGDSRTSSSVISCIWPDYDRRPCEPVGEFWLGANVRFGVIEWGRRGCRGKCKGRQTRGNSSPTSDDFAKFGESNEYRQQRVFI